MKRASTITEAGYGGCLRPDRDLWAEELTKSDFEELYQPGRRGDGSLSQSEVPSTSDQVAKVLLAGQRPKVLVTGQKGSGKSVELRRLLFREDVTGRFHAVTMQVTQQLDLFQEVDMRYFLLALAARLATEIDGIPSSSSLNWKARGGKGLTRWVSLLTDLEVTDVPKHLDDAKEVRLGIRGFVEWVGGARGEPARRKQLSDSQQYPPGRIADVVNDLLDLLEWIVGRPILLVVDDGDKIFHENSVRDVFVTHARQLMELRCPVVLTYPFWLDFLPDFQAVQRLAARAVRLANPKVITRAAPEVVLDSARQWFHDLYGRLVVPEGRAWVDDRALTTVIRMSAGIPREFLRILERAFMVADDLGEAALTETTIQSAVGGLRREMLPATQSEETRRRLQLVRLTRNLRDTGDRQLLEALMVVELSNDEPWYDVHPFLAPFADRLLNERAAGLQAPGALKEPELREKLITSLTR